MITQIEMQYAVSSRSPEAQKRLHNEMVVEIVYGRSLEPPRDGLFYLFQGDRERKQELSPDNPLIPPETPREIPVETRSPLPLGESTGRDGNSPEGTGTVTTPVFTDVNPETPAKPKKKSHHKGKY